jgi:uncharacterized protein YqhQ
MANARYVSVGGQAVIEGVMMRSTESVATAVRRPDGEISVRVAPFVAITRRRRWLNVPVLRGFLSLVETLALGMSALTYSAEQAMAEEAAADATATGADGDGAKTADAGAVRAKKPAISQASMALTMITSFALGLLFFFWLPLKLTEWTGVKSSLAFNAIDGAFRLAVFLLYLWAISLWGEMRRILQYHGAEHKSIACLEAGLPLEVENARTFSRFHPRCGTSFLLSVMILSILLFLLLGRPETLGDRLLRFAMIPFIAGVSFEYIRLSGKYASVGWVGALAKPGLLVQHLTTKEPSPDQLEVALEALRACLPADRASLFDFDERAVRVS